MRRRTASQTRGAAALAFALLLGGCAGDANPLRDVLVGVGVGPTPSVAPDFVARSRPAVPAGYVPIGAVPRARAEPKSVEEVAAAEAELEARGETNRRLGDSARRLSLAPPPEPVRVDPPPALDALAPVRAP